MWIALEEKKLNFSVVEVAIKVSFTAPPLKGLVVFDLWICHCLDEGAEIKGLIFVDLILRLLRSTHGSPIFILPPIRISLSQPYLSAELKNLCLCSCSEGLLIG